MNREGKDWKGGIPGSVKAKLARGGDVAQLVERRTDTPLTQVRFPGAASFFLLPESTFSADSLTCVRTPPSATTRINICAHVKDPVVHVRVRWIMETLKHTACTVDWVARLCRSWLFPGKATRISHVRNPSGAIHWSNKINKIYSGLLQARKRKPL